MSTSYNRPRLHALGVAFNKDIVEVYVANHLNAVLLHGWFDKEAGFAIVCERPPCVIVAGAGVLPEEFIEELEARGHKVILMPLAVSAPNWRQAKTCCEAALNCLKLAKDHGYPVEAMPGYQFA